MYAHTVTAEYLAGDSRWSRVGIYINPRNAPHKWRGLAASQDSDCSEHVTVYSDRQKLDCWRFEGLIPRSAAELYAPRLSPYNA